MNEPEQRAEGFQRNGPKTATHKARRVSQRKELAIVTLGAVAAITGVGGLLAASPPSGASVDTAYQTPTFGEPEPAQSDGETPSEASTTESQPPTEQKQEPKNKQEPVQQPGQQDPAPAPSWSAPVSQQEPPAAESRGS